jgi:hypothetical protein
MKWLVFAYLLLLPFPALAGWYTCPGLTTDTGTGIAAPTYGLQVCVRQTTATDPARLDARACRGGVDITFQDPTGPNYDANVLVYQCSGAGAAGVFTDCKLVPIDRDGDGSGDGLPLTGDEASLQFGLWGLTGDWYAFDVTNGSSRTIEIKATCR